MGVLVPHLLTALVLLLIRIMLIREGKTDLKDKSGNAIVKLPKVLFVVGLLDAVVCALLLILMYCFPNSTSRPWIYFVFTSFFALGCCMMHLTVSWKITYSIETDFFVYRSALLRSRKFYYRECYCRFETGEIIITNDVTPCKIHIPKEALGFDHFAQIVRQKSKRRTPKS